MVDTKQLLNQLIGSGVAGGLAGGALSGLLTSKAGRKFAGSALKLGGVAIVGGLAYKAYQNYRQSQPGVNSGGTTGERVDAITAPLDGRFLPLEEDTAGHEALGLLLL